MSKKFIEKILKEASINDMWNSQYFTWPFKDGDKVELLKPFNDSKIPAGEIGTVDLKNPKFLWIIWDNEQYKYSSVGKTQLSYFKKI